VIVNASSTTKNLERFREQTHGLSELWTSRRTIAHANANGCGL
jgi:hypothetical protein